MVQKLVAFRRKQSDGWFGSDEISTSYPALIGFNSS